LKDMSMSFPLELFEELMKAGKTVYINSRVFTDQGKIEKIFSVERFGRNPYPIGIVLSTEDGYYYICIEDIRFLKWSK